MDWAEVAQKLGFTGSTEGKWSVLGLTWTHIEPQGRLHAPAGAHARSAATCLAGSSPARPFAFVESRNTLV